MSDLEKRVNDYINNELLDFNNINTNPLEGDTLKDGILNRLFSRKWSRKAQFDALPEEEKEIRLKRAETNIMWNGKEDLTNISEEERNKFIYESRTLNESFLDIDYELRGKEYFEKDNLIPLLGSFGLGAGGEAWLHLASNSSSMVDFWAGMGILEVREDKIIQKTISKKQFDQIKDQLIKVNLSNDLVNISDNYSWIYVYEGKLPF